MLATSASKVRRGGQEGTARPSSSLSGVAFCATRLARACRIASDGHRSARARARAIPIKTIHHAGAVLALRGGVLLPDRPVGRRVRPQSVGGDERRRSEGRCSDPRAWRALPVVHGQHLPNVLHRSRSQGPTPDCDCVAPPRWRSCRGDGIARCRTGSTAVVSRGTFGGFYGPSSCAAWCLHAPRVPREALRACALSSARRGPSSRTYPHHTHTHRSIPWMCAPPPPPCCDRDVRQVEKTYGTLLKLHEKCIDMLRPGAELRTVRE